MIKIYTIYVNRYNELIPSETERIVQKSKLVSTLRFLTETTYKDIDISDFTVLMEYKLPVSHEYKAVYLSKSDDLVDGELEYKLTLDTDITKEAGNVSVQLSFYGQIMNENGEITQYVRHTTPIDIPIVPLASWSDMIPDDLLTPLDQRILKLDAQNRQIADLILAVDDNHVDNLIYENGKLQLSKKGNPIGDQIDIFSDENEQHGSNVKIVEF